MPQQGSKGRAKYPGTELFNAKKATKDRHVAHVVRIRSYQPLGSKLQHRLMVGSQTAAMQHKINKRKKI